MKNLYKKIFIVFFIAIIVLATTMPFNPAKAQRSTGDNNGSNNGNGNNNGNNNNGSGGFYENCVEWTLIWTSPPEGYKENEPVPVGYLGEGQPKNPVRSTTGPPVLPVPLFGIAEWKCSEKDTILGSAQTELEGRGLVACRKAAELAAKFGGFTVLDPNFSSKIEKKVLENITNFLKDTFKENLGVDFSNPQELINEGGKFIEEKFNELIGNPLKDKTSREIAKLEKEGKEKLKELAQDYLKNATKDIIQIPGIPGIGGDVGATAVPVEDKKAIEQQKVIEKKIDQQIIEQKIDRVIADTRQQCEQILKKTQETIKKALLYQLTTQIVDWIETGEAPQFIKNPGQFLKETSQLAVDRFISKVAPRLCEPFRVSIQAQVSVITHRRVNPFYEEVTCTLDKVINNFKDFYNNFNVGGFIAYRELLNPRNNTYGLSILVQEEALLEQIKAQKEAEKLQEKGFVGQTRCIRWNKYVPSIGPVFAEYQINNKNYMLAGSDPNGPFDENGKIKEEFDPRKRNQPMPWPIRTGVRFSNSDGSIIWECDDYIVTSPATVAASLTERAAQVDIDYLAATSDIEQFMGSISDAIISKLTKAGLKGLQKLLPEINIITP